MYIEKLKKAVEYIQKQGIEKIDSAVILGSGLGNFAESIENAIILDYKDIPNFPVSTVEGHAGRLIYGDIKGKKVLAMQGRFHYYEGYEMEDVVFPVRVMAMLGVENLIVTNAAGGVNPKFKCGQLMLIKDHINFMGTNPLIGKNINELGVRFPDMSSAYSKDGIKLAKEIANKLDIDLTQGVYAAFTGPSYETPAEIKMIHSWGADAVGMSTVPEVIVANHAKINVIGISCVTNMAAGLQQSLNHEEVVKASAMVQESFKKLVTGIIVQL